MGQSKPRSRSSNWSSVRCLAAPNFLCYANACSTRPDLDRDPRQITFIFCLCFLFPLAHPPSPIQASTRITLSFLSSVASRLTSFGDEPFPIVHQHRACNAQNEACFLNSPTLF